MLVRHAPSVLARHRIEDSAPASISRIRLREIDGRCPTITLKRAPDEAKQTPVVLGSKRCAGASYKSDPAGNNKIVATSHEIDHPDIRPAHCVIAWRNGQPTVHVLKLPPEARPPQVYVSDSFWGDGSWVYVSDSQRLSIGAVLSFSAGRGPPSFLVEGAVPLLEAADGSPPTFRLLELDSSLLLAAVLPSLSLGDLATLALTNAECADLVAEYLPLPQRWEEHPSAIAEALGQVKTWPELLRAMKLVSAHVDVSEDALWCLATGRARPYYWCMQPMRDGLPIRDEVERRVANAVCLLIPLAEATGLWQILTALAPRMTPTSLVRLLESMRLALGATWPKGPFSLPTRHDYDHDARWISLPRLDASAIGAALPRCRAAWTPELLVGFSLAVGASGAMVREYVYQATGDDEIASDALLAQVETLGLAAMEDVDEQAAYLVGLNESEDGIFEDVAQALMFRVTNGSPLSLSLIGAITVRDITAASHALHSATLLPSHSVSRVCS